VGPGDGQKLWLIREVGGLRGEKIDWTLTVKEALESRIQGIGISRRCTSARTLRRCERPSNRKEINIACWAKGLVLAFVFFTPMMRVARNWLAPTPARGRSRGGMIRRSHGTMSGRYSLVLQRFRGALDQPVISMKIFVAGATGALGRRLIPLLISAGHKVAGMTRSPAKGSLLQSMTPAPLGRDDSSRKALRASLLQGKEAQLKRRATGSIQIRCRHIGAQPRRSVIWSPQSLPRPPLKG
jgi:hypothetical protein